MDAKQYADGLTKQLRKGFLAYCVLRVCANGSRYSSDIIQELHNAELVVVEGTMYPLLARLQKDGLLVHEWRESAQGPPRKYYSLTNDGRVVIEYMTEQITTLNTIMMKLGRIDK